MEEAHTLEFREINTKWENDIQNHLTFTKEQLSNLKEKHNAEKAQVLDRLEKQLPKKPKYSAVLLNMMKIQANLARAKEYGEANMVKQRVIAMQNEEDEKWRQDRLKKINTQLSILQKRHDNEENSMRMKYEEVENTLKKSKSVELEKLVQKYQNMKQELLNYQQQEFNRAQKPPFKA